MTESHSQRLARLERALKSGRVPSILKPLVGADVLVRAYGWTPGVDVYIPNINDSPERAKQMRALIKANRQYRKDRQQVGTYLSRDERRRESANRKLEKFRD